MVLQSGIGGTDFQENCSGSAKWNWWNRLLRKLQRIAKWFVKWNKIGLLDLKDLQLKAWTSESSNNGFGEYV